MSKLEEMDKKLSQMNSIVNLADPENNPVDTANALSVLEELIQELRELMKNT